MLFQFLKSGFRIAVVFKSELAQLYRCYCASSSLRSDCARGAEVDAANHPPKWAVVMNGLLFQPFRRKLSPLSLSRHPRGRKEGKALSELETEANKKPDRKKRAICHFNLLPT